MNTRRYQEQLNQLYQKGLYRKIISPRESGGHKIKCSDILPIDFTSNNYLCLAGDSRIHQAVKNALDTWGWGSKASQLVSGHLSPHQSLRKRLAGWLAKDDCLLFPSGYTTNLCVLSTLPGIKDLIVVDKLCHASLIDGAQASKAKLRTFTHRDYDKLRRLLDRGGFEQIFIVTDSLFSMEGDFARLEELVELRDRYDACLIVDEAHAFGCLGPDGRGLAARADLLDKVDIFIATFSKALGGVGGFVVGPQVLMDYLVNRGRGLIYTTSPPAACCAAAETALDIIIAEPQRRQRLLDNGEYFRNLCRELNLDTGHSQSYIAPIILGNPEQAVTIANVLREQDLLVWPMRPPTVPLGRSLLRVSLTSEHSHKDIDTLAHALKRAIMP
ncbi:MAG: 8-amino-7-oxononanoate synthase [Sedimentisphaerales bacterium]|nr:8-amino-7-oxononanoate synthase [Sedimentisphaerales bacterium]